MLGDFPGIPRAVVNNGIESTKTLEYLTRITDQSPLKRFLFPQANAPLNTKLSQTPGRANRLKITRSLVCVSGSGVFIFFSVLIARVASPLASAVEQPSKSIPPNPPGISINRI